ncbi:hypothetical protein NN561_012674 [Cricetulus griseus]
MLALINLIIRRTRLAFRTPARLALVLRSLPALPVPRHDFDRGFEAKGEGVGCSRRDRNLGGGTGSQLQGFSLTPCPLVTRLGSGSGACSLCAPGSSGLRALTALQTKGPGLRAYYRDISEAWHDPLGSRSALGLWSIPGPH